MQWSKVHLSSIVIDYRHMHTPDWKLKSDPHLHGGVKAVHGYSITDN